MHKLKNIAILGGSGLLGKSMQEKHGKEYDFLILQSCDADLTKEKETDEIIGFIKNEGIEVVINLAAKVGGIRLNSGHQMEMYKTNAAICLNVIESCMKHDIAHLSTALSTCVFPAYDDDKYPLTEDSFYGGNGLPRSNYGYALAKRAAYEMTELAAVEGHNYTTFAPTNLFGVHDNFDLESSHYVAAVIEKVSKAKEGTVLEFLGTSDTLRQQLYAPDCATMVLKVATELDYAPNKGPIILTTNSISNEEVIKKVIAISGKDLTYTFNGLYPGQRMKDFSSGLYVELFGEPDLTPIDEALRTVYDSRN